MRLATWNVNSIRAREARLLAWLAEVAPDVVCLQETKVVDEAFPHAALAAAGYRAAAYGQAGYNGVAILARAPLVDVERGLGDGEPDDQARLIAASVDGVRIVSAYVPNGGALGSDKYAYKLRWLARFRAYLAARVTAAAPWFVAGDMNIAPDDRDVHDPVAWAGQVSCTPPERVALAEAVAPHLVDAFRQHEPRGGHFTWWDYRGMAFFRDHGVRIDHAYLSAPLAARSRACRIDRAQRKGTLPSDHAPVIVELA